MPENYSYTMYFGRNLSYTAVNGHKVKTEVRTTSFNIFIQDSVNIRFSGFTVTDATGYWNGEFEKTFILEVVGNDYDEDSCKEICREYCREFGQVCVMLKTTPIDSVEFVSLTEK